MKVVGFIILILFYFSCASANDSIIVRKDPRLDILTVKQANINRISSRLTSDGRFKGYRLQVLSTRNREEAFQLKAELFQRFPDQKAYTLYQSPYFKVRFGNYLERAEAERNKKILSQLYPNSIYVVPDLIDYKLKEGEDIFLEE
jgi:hypothetical protein